MFHAIEVADYIWVISILSNIFEYSVFSGITCLYTKAFIRVGNLDHTSAINFITTDMIRTGGVGLMGNGDS